MHAGHDQRGVSNLPAAGERLGGGAAMLGTACREDRFDDGLAAGSQSPKPPILRRRTVACLTLLGLAAIAYGTLAPFKLDVSRPPAWALRWEGPVRGDAAANILIYIPIGACARLLMRRRGSFWLVEVLASLLLAGGMSYAAEVAQSLVPARVSTWTDVILNLGGAAVGVLLAPTAQRLLRGSHSVLYIRLRFRPLEMAAAALTLCIFAYALSPPDFYPSTHHVARSWDRFWPLEDAWAGVLAGYGAGGVWGVRLVDKILVGAVYGLLAFVLLLSRREAGSPAGVSLWHALSRSAALALVLEAAQSFTLSHAAEPRDLAWAWVCCGLGAASGGLAATCCPRLQQSPHTLLRGLVILVAAALVAWGLLSMLLTPASAAAMRINWLPMTDDFDRSWNALLGDYVTGFLQYTLISGLVLLWYRGERRRPWALLAVAASVCSGLLCGIVGLSRGQPFDTAQILLAGGGALFAVRMDRAVFGRRTPARGVQGGDAAVSRIR